mmetsp:Transcript_22254/g.49782  ORF Transcript_22254/g.49782 Transcript_22254/m.49782 type:complete len:179 (+) Transcript_22254:145-681(+)
MCNTMWGEAFNVSNAEGFDEHAYTMWFYQLANPNFDTASYWNKSLGTNSAGQYECLLEYYPENHLDYSVTQTTGDWGECQAYSQHSCCKNTTVASFETVNQAYGPEYHIDRCGPLSQACENYFMNENCLYECDPTAGTPLPHTHTLTDHIHTYIHTHTHTYTHTHTHTRTQTPTQTLT